MSAPLAPIAGPTQKRDFSLFEQHRSLLRRLYLEEGKSSAQVKKEMETYYGFPEIEAKMYEYAWNHLGFFKKLSIDDWIRVDVRVKKRKEREGKETDVFLSGVLQPPKKIHRSITRHRKRSDLQHRIGREPTPNCPNGVLLRTPPRSPNMTVTNLRNPATQVPVVSLDVSLDVSIIDSETGDSLDLKQLSDRIRKLMISKPDSVVHWLAHAPSSQLILAFRQHDGVEYVAFHGQGSYTTDPFDLTWDSAFRIPAQRHFLEALSKLSMIFANNQKIEVTDHKQLLAWIGADANKLVLKDFFAQDLIAMVATWAQLIRLSAQLKSGEAFQTLVEIGFTTHDGEWIQQHVSILVDSTTILGSKRVGKIARRLLSNEHIRVETCKSAKFYYQEIANGGQLDLEMMSEFSFAGVPLTFNDSTFCNLFRHSTQSPNPFENTRQLADLLRLAGYNFNSRMQSFWFKNRVCFHFDELQDGDSDHSLDFFFCHLDYLWLITGHDICETILSHSTEFDTQMTIVGLILAARGGIKQLFIYLNSRPASKREHQLFLELSFSMASGRGDVAAIRSFVEAKVDPNTHVLLSTIHNAQVNWHPLMRAIRSEQWEVVTLLVGLGVELRSNIKFFNPLSATIWKPKPLSDSKRLGQLEIVRYFIGKDLIDVYGADAMIKAVVPPFFQSDAFIPDEEVVGMLTKAGVKIGEIIADGKNILHFAIERSCNLETVEFLISRGAQIHSQPCPQDGKTMLHSAAASSSKDRQKIVELLVSSGADCTTEWGGPTVLESALSVRYQDNELSLPVFSFLLDRGAQLNGPEDRLPGVKGHWAPIVTLLLGLEAPDALIYKTIQAGADINSIGLAFYPGLFTPLQYAIYRGRQDVARHLITRGVDVNAPAAGYFGRTALQAACDPLKGVETSLGFIQFLLDKGADINAPAASDGATALQCAIMNGSVGAFCLLLDAGAKIFDTTKFSTEFPDALCTAAGFGRLDMVDMILKKLARSDNQVMRLCHNACQKAKIRGHFAIVKMLDKFITANKA
ncbi:ankyrin repeat-containing domain protein [Xylaria flabelliformis]|nr:ankyrin repeat-containing domain protein [Xylaria flabelliformis]